MEYEFILRIFCAAVLGGLIGLEREYRAKEAGFRTHFLVALGSAVFMIVSAYGFSDVALSDTTGRWDVSRVAAQVVSGIGFIGAGTIMVNRGHIKGLTTAAGLWTSACIGLAIGTGFYEAAIVGSIAVLIVERWLKRLKKRIMRKRGLLDDTEPVENESRIVD